MVTIRLRRTGAKKQPHYRVVVTDSRSPRDGKFLEIIGHYNPRTEPPTVEIDAERALYWLGVGAQPSEAVKRMLDKMGIMAQVPAVRKGAKSVDEILAGLELTKTAKAAPKKEPVVAAVPVEEEAEAFDFDDEDADADVEEEAEAFDFDDEDADADVEEEIEAFDFDDEDADADVDFDEDDDEEDEDDEEDDEEDD